MIIMQLYCVALLLSIKPALETPMLSADGNGLTKLIVGGVFYEVKSADAVPEFVYRAIPNPGSCLDTIEQALTLGVSELIPAHKQLR